MSVRLPTISIGYGAIQETKELLEADQRDVVLDHMLKDMMSSNNLLFNSIAAAYSVIDPPGDCKYLTFVHAASFARAAMENHHAKIASPLFDQTGLNILVMRLHCVPLYQDAWTAITANEDLEAALLEVFEPELVDEAECNAVTLGSGFVLHALACQRLNDSSLCN